MRKHRQSTMTLVSTEPVSAPNPTKPEKAVNQACEPCEAEIRILAYHKWVSAGKPEGDGIQFWLEAEKDLRNH